MKRIELVKLSLSIRSHTRLARSALVGVGLSLNQEAKNKGDWSGRLAAT